MFFFVFIDQVTCRPNQDKNSNLEQQHLVNVMSIHSSHDLLHFSGIFSLYSFSRLSIMPLHLDSQSPFQNPPQARLVQNYFWHRGDRVDVSRPALWLRMLVVSFPRWTCWWWAPPPPGLLHLPANNRGPLRSSPKTWTRPFKLSWRDSSGIVWNISRPANIQTSEFLTNPVAFVVKFNHHLG